MSATRRLNPVTWRLPGGLGRLCELFALSWLSLAQPVLSILEHNPQEFVQRRSTWSEVALLVSVLTIVPPVLLWVLSSWPALIPQLSASHRSNLIRRLHLALCAGLVAIATTGIAKEFAGAGTKMVLGTAFVATIGYAVARLKWDGVATATRLLAVAPVLYAVYFMLLSPVAPYLGETSTESVAVEVDRPAPVVMIVLDELPTASLLDGNGQIDADLFPNIAGLAADSTWYRNHTTVAPYTDAAVPALLTGDLPSTPSLPPASRNFPHNLFALLDGTYQLNVIESKITHLCESNSCDRAARGEGSGGLGGLIGRAGDLWGEAVDPDRETSAPDLGMADMPVEEEPQLAFRRFIRQLDDTDWSEPSLHFLHALLPHQPWMRLGDGRQYEAPNPSLGLTFFQWDDQPSASRGRTQHLLQLQATDALVGEVLAKLQALEVYEESLVVLTSDHGVSFIPSEPLRGASPGNLHDIMWTPLILKRPGQTEGAVVDEVVRNVDVMPTLADLLDFELPAPVDGRSLEAMSLEGEAGADEPKRLALLDWRLNREELAVGTDGFVDIDPAIWFPKVLRTPASPGVAGDPLRLHRIGPHPDLIGSEVDGLSVTARDDTVEVLTEIDTAPEVADGSRTLPAHIEARLTRSQSLPVAVALNGQIGLVAETRDDSKGTGHFWGILPESLFQVGENQIDFYLVDDGADSGAAGISLIPLKISR